MKIFKRILIGCATLVALLLISGLFTKKDYAVQRSVVIDRPKEEVFEYVRFLRNQDEYSKWAMMDPLMKKSYTGTDGTVGFIATWDSENDEVGSGEQEIKKIVEGKRIDFELRFFRPFEATEPAFISTESLSDSQTKVVWGFSGHMNYPFNLWLLVIDFEEMIGNDLAEGLTKMKTILENKPEEDAHRVF